jgi:hypothetical protein
VPQPPQFAALVRRLAQTPAQSVVPVGQAQLLFTQTSCPAHTWAQNPQLSLSFWRFTQLLPQRASPEPHAAEQVPLEQTWPAAQRLPQVPQLVVLVSRSTQVVIPPMPMPVQAVSPAGQPAAQAPLTQVWAAVQRLPQEPQFRASLPVSVQIPLQLVSPPPQAQAPFVQLAPVPHTVPQAPQSLGSLVRSTHALEQLVSPDAQLVVQAPLEQTWPVAQASPQPPQFEGSPWMLVQTPLQRVPPL